MLEFDQAGNLVRHWGGPGQGYEWPRVEPRHHVDYKGNVWIGGNGANDGHILKFTQRRQVRRSSSARLGERRQQRPWERSAASRRSRSTKANEAYVADGYGNKRVAVIDMDTGKIKRYWGAYGNKPDDTNLGQLQPERAAGAAVPQPGALRRAVERRLRLRLRPPERPHPGVHARTASS